jgi:Xaa-Pro aminopeptidase
MNKKVQLIQRFLIDNNYKFFLITNNDIHLNESPNLFQKDIYNISGFDCSHGYLLIFIDRIVFFTDSRYTLAASKFFPKSIKVYDLRNKSLSKYIIALGSNFKGIVDTKLISTQQFLDLSKHLSPAKITIHPLKAQIYQKVYFPDFNRSYAFSLPKNYIPRSYDKNIQWAKNRINSEGLLIWNNAHVAYLLNIRSFELDNSTKPFAGLFIPKKNAKPIIISNNSNLNNISKIKNNFQLLSFEKFKSFLKRNNFKKIEFEFKYTNYEIYYSLNKFLQIFETPINIDKYLSQKTKVEQKNIINCHYEDGLTMTKFLIQLKTKKLKFKNEYHLSNALYELRKEGVNFFRNSFDYISAFDANGSLVHYRPLPSNSTIFKNQSLLLIDSGAHYLEGTTDVTRVLKLYSPVKKKIKSAYTYLLKSLLKLEKTHFPLNLLASDLDFFIRSFLQKYNINYGHGTGHGVGYFNDVHEKYPIISPSSNQKILNGNFFSIEPGFYVPHEFGLRIENLYFAKKFDNHIKLEGVTLVPYELDLINWKLINTQEKLSIKKYHKKIYHTFQGQLEPIYRSYFEKNLINKL